jgi:hypothetical protein
MGKFNTSYYATQILDPLSVWRGTQIGRTNQKLIVLADNARPHTAKVALDLMKGAPHPPYSSDLSPPGFSLSGYVKRLLRGHGFVDREALLHAIGDIFRGLEK